MKPGAELDLIEVLPADGATVGTLDPRLEALIVQIVTTGQEMCYEFRFRLLLDQRWWLLQRLLVIGLQLDRGLGFALTLQLRSWSGQRRGAFAEVAETDNTSLCHDTSCAFETQFAKGSTKT